MKLLFTIFLIFYLNQINIQANEYNAKETEMFKNLRCLICQGQSVFDSDSDFAISLKLVVKNKIDEGFTEDQIYKFLNKKYGELILYDPQFNKNTYFLWFLPLLIFLFGGAIILKKIINIKK